VPFDPGQDDESIDVAQDREVVERLVEPVVMGRLLLGIL
jgi:hypothetical protein